MVIAARIEYLRSQVYAGFSLTASILPNPETGKVKFKFLLYPEPSVLSGAILAASTDTLDRVLQLDARYSSVDRGHCHSNGVYEVSVWFSTAIPDIEPPSTAPRRPRRRSQRHSFNAQAPAFVPTPTAVHAADPPAAAPQGVPPLLVSVARERPPAAAFAPIPHRITDFPVGSSIVVCGLSARPELNGLTGIVVSQIHATGRIGVRAANAECSLRPGNLELYT